MCPGCGAYAPDIAPPSHSGDQATTATAEWDSFRAERSPAPKPPSGPGSRDVAGARAGTAVPDGSAGDGPVTASGSTASGAPGRAARRRQLARWKKNRRRAVAGTAIALVGGGLTIAALPSGSSKGKMNAVSAPDTVTPNAARMSEPISPSAEPAKKATRKPDSGPSPTAVPRQRTATITVARPAATPPPQRPATEAAARPEAQRSEAPAPRPTADDSAAQKPSASGSTGDSGTSGEDRAEATPSQTATTSPSEVCLLVLCLG
ncbi:hypothetical protein QFZ82_000837 [Streptomyces sp. V4I23]|uniref:SCO2400 family protein n=1 Tax=Streptomyces sp. V4I23 TaxID=3042282 RepID=UPI00277E918D|nr:hypothetical protein [Streptomyces sp. V4I23]MDQ1006352.1 hypothetical protein [Streptomyces sp. V4I23]